MAVTAPPRRPSVAARRAGYVIAAAINGALILAVNVWPGWESLSFLTDETTQVLGWVNVSLAAGLVTNVVYLFRDPPWVKSLGDMVTAAIALVVSIRVWQVFPFDFRGYAFDWALLVRVGLIVAIVGSAIGVIVRLVSLVRDAALTNHGQE